MVNNLKLRKIVYLAITLLLYLSCMEKGAIVKIEQNVQAEQLYKYVMKNPGLATDQGEYFAWNAS